MRDLTAFPDHAKRIAGYALRIAQQNGMHGNAKPMRGRLAELTEISVEDQVNRTFRVMYFVRHCGHVYVLHAFLKKAKRRIKTPQRELDVIERRLKTARAHFEENYAAEKAHE